MEDATLVDLILRRDRHALHEFYCMYAPRLQSFISRKVGNPHDAEEIVQDTLFAFLEALRDFQGNCSLSTFLFSIGRHKILDYYRRKKLTSFVFSQAPNFGDIISPLLNPEEALDATLLKEKLKTAFSLILPRYKIVLQLKYIENQPVSEIARYYSWTIKKTECLLSRARKAFVHVFLAL